MKEIRIAERSVSALTKEELLALGYREVGDTMRKEYPAGSPFGLEAGLAIFREAPGAAGAYEAGNGLLTLFYYKRSWDAGEFVTRVAKAILEYRKDMEKLGIPENPETKEPEGEEE